MLHTSTAGSAIQTRVERRGGLVRYVATVGADELGVVEYDPGRETLTLINRNVALARNVLLLGHSVKAQHADVAGQFGEGMKVGALALLREGRTVVMHTAQEQWSWARAMDEQFGVRVLSIFISRRDPDLALETGRELVLGNNAIRDLCGAHHW